MHPDLQVEQLCRLGNDGEAQSGSFLDAVIGQLYEFFKNDFCFFLGNANPGIPDLDPALALMLAAGNQNAALVGIAQRIDDQVLKNAAQ